MFTMFKLALISSSTSTIATPLVFFLVVFFFSSSSSSFSFSGTVPHFDHYQRCFASLAKADVLEQCLQQAKEKWSSGLTEKPSSCCALYEALNCAQARSCELCADEVLDDFAAYRRRVLLSASTWLCPDGALFSLQNGSLNEVCSRGADTVVPLDIADVCPGRRRSWWWATPVGLALAIGLFLLGIAAAIGLLVVVFRRRRRSRRSKSEQTLLLTLKSAPPE